MVSREMARSSLPFTVAKNAVANVARGTASALVALAVPPFLTRTLSPDKYGAWALVLQLAAYVGYLEFGVTTAVGRFVAHGNERSNFDHRNRIVNTALALLTGIGILAMIFIVLLIATLPRIFRDMPAGLYPDVRVALALVGCSLAIGLPACVFNGIFVGLQRYEIPAAIVAGSRIVSAVLIIATAHEGGGIPAMALVVAVVNLSSYVLQWAMYKRYASDIPLSGTFISRETASELVKYCSSLAVWSFSMLLISGLDLALVSALNFQKTAFYAVATTLVTFIAGLQNTVFNAVVPASAIFHARGASDRLGRLVIDGTRYGTLLLLLTGLPLLLVGGPILRVWVGSAYATQGLAFLQILVIANMVRLSAVPYVVTLIGTGEQRLVVLTPFLESMTNLSISVLAGYYWGAIGVAIGTLCGAFVGIAGNFLYNMPRTVEVQFSLREYAMGSLLKPTLCVLPLGISLIAQNHEMEPLVRVIAISIGGAVTFSCLWRWGLLNTDRERVRSIVRFAGL